MDRFYSTGTGLAVQGIFNSISHFSRRLDTGVHAVFFFFYRDITLDFSFLVGSWVVTSQHQSLNVNKNAKVIERIFKAPLLSIK